MFDLAVLFVIIGIILMLVGNTARMNLDTAQGDWWGIFIPIGIPLFLIGLVFIIVRCAVVIWLLIFRGHII